MAELPMFEGNDISAYIAVDFSNKFTAGGYSDVYQGTWAAAPGRSPLAVAVKMPRYTTRNVKAMRKIIRSINGEISLWGQLSHPNILPLLGLYWRDEPGPLTIPGAVSPWCNGGTIVEYAESARQGCVPGISQSVKDDSFSLLYLEVELLSQVANGVSYLHERNIVHGDLKGCNILVRDGTAQLGDFGYSVVLAQQSSSTSSHLGTHRWFAPESLNSGAHRTREADIWALGCVVMEVRTLDLPWAGRKDTAVPVALAEGRWPYACPQNINGKLWRMVVECWGWDGKFRPTSKELRARLEDLINSLRTIHKAFSSSRDMQPNELTSERPTSIALSLLSFLLAEITRSQTEPDSAWQKFLTLGAVREVTKALNGVGDRYPRKVIRRLARAVASTDRDLAEQITSNLSSGTCLQSPELRYFTISQLKCKHHYEVIAPR
ncbi:kinase-like protein [Exidia glandulosa HHB12029]|uniref:Kinase-like protein n=1 Tax=Exidia glandulosa HHB12029 TaxID=1314781 RepID=A0A166N923_EXIGL|nr:kinase-like protein [Exidia glandulosa HHB12029]